MNTGKDLLNTIATPELAELSEGVIEALIDGTLEDGFLKDLPIFGSLMAIVKTGVAFRERRLMEKIVAFINEVANLSASERARVVAELAGTGDKQEKVGELVIEMLDRADSIRKPALIGKLFVAMGRKKIDPKDLLRLCTMVNGVFLEDLSLLASTRTVGSVDHDRRFALQANGFLASSLRDVGLRRSSDLPVEMKWIITKDGRAVLENCFPPPIDPYADYEDVLVY